MNKIFIISRKLSLFAFILSLISIIFIVFRSQIDLTFNGIRDYIYNPFIHYLVVLIWIFSVFVFIVEGVYNIKHKHLLSSRNIFIVIGISINLISLFLFLF